MRPVIHGGDIYQNEIELDFSVNINPFGIPEKVKEAMQESLELCEHYPDIHHAKLIEKIGAHYHIPEEHILCGNGASSCGASAGLYRSSRAGACCKWDRRRRDSESSQ